MEEMNLKKKVIILFSVMLATFNAMVNMTIVHIALPKIIASIGGMEYFQWVFTIYMLSATVSSMLGGKLSDLYGRKKLILFGIAVFTIASFLCGTASSIYGLIIYRFIQGIGGGLIISTSVATLGDLFVPRERGKWHGMFGIVLGLSSIIGPTLGGLIVDNFSWMWVFWLFIPVGILSFLLIIKLYPTYHSEEKPSIDYVGAAIVAIFLASLILGFSILDNEGPYRSLIVSLLFLLATISFICLLFYENKIPNPTVPLHLFSNRIFAVVNGMSFVVGVSIFGINAYIPFYIQGVLGKSATDTGMIVMTMMLAMVSSSVISGQLVSRLGKYKWLALLGMLFLLVGFASISILHMDSSLTQSTISLIIIGAGLGTLSPVLQVAIQNAVSPSYLGVAVSSVQVFRQIGGMIGIAVLGVLMKSIMYNRLEESEEKVITLLGEGEGQLISTEYSAELLMDIDKMGQTLEILSEDMRPAFEQWIIYLRDALNFSLTYVFVSMAFIAVLGLVISIFLKDIPLRTTNKDVVEERGWHD